MLTKPALTGSCRPLSLMHCFLTHRFLHQIICLKKSLNYLELQKIVGDCGFVALFYFHIQSHFPLSSPVSLHNYFCSLSSLTLLSDSFASSLTLRLFLRISFPPSFCPSFPPRFSLSSPSISLSTGVSGRLCRVET